MGKILLEDEELLEATSFYFLLPDGVDSPCLMFMEGEERDNAIARAAVKRIAEHIKNLPTAGHDKWYFYNQD